MNSARQVRDGYGGGFEITSDNDLYLHRQRRRTIRLNFLFLNKGFISKYLIVRRKNIIINFMTVH